MPTISSTEGYQRTSVVAKPNSGALTKDHFVDVPFEVSPGELFRVLIAGDEYLVSCPNISCPGERIVVTLNAE
jgi:hypothetical protein